MFNIPCYYFFSRYVSGVFLYLWLFLASPHHHLSLLRHDQPPSRPGKSSSIKPIFVIKSLNPCVWMPFSLPSWWIKMSMIIMVVLPRPELAAPALSRWGTRKEWEIHFYFQLFKNHPKFSYQLVFAQLKGDKSEHFCSLWNLFEVWDTGFLFAVSKTENLCGLWKWKRICSVWKWKPI